jgi:hypothetical protein
MDCTQIKGNVEMSGRYIRGGIEMICRESRMDGKNMQFMNDRYDSGNKE